MKTLVRITTHSVYSLLVSQLLLAWCSVRVEAFAFDSNSRSSPTTPSRGQRGPLRGLVKDTETKSESEHAQQELFDQFASFLLSKQSEIIDQLETVDGSGERFSRDAWGIFAANANADGEPTDATNTNTNTPAIHSRQSGGITRVIQKGHVIEKGACSFTLIQRGVLSAERALAIQGRQQNRNDATIDTDTDTDPTDNDTNTVDGLPNAMAIQEGDIYSAAALSIVLHTRSPMVPTFRSDVRIFMVKSSSSSAGRVTAWFGGGADLTPYYLFDDDIRSFHESYRDLCRSHFSVSPVDVDVYNEMKRACDDYFYLPARSEHRGTGGIFFDDMVASNRTLSFTEAVADAWMPSWLPIVNRRKDTAYTEQQRQWQLLRRGRYLEFNLLYDRGVKFGLAHANPRVEGVMVSAPPLIAWEYNHVIEKGSEEERLMTILKKPIDWVTEDA